MAYLERGERPEGCFMCEIGAGTAGPEGEAIVVWRGRHVFALLNAFPYSNGHVLVAPYAHEAHLDLLEGAVAAELIAAAQLIVAALRRTYQPQGFNVGANLGTAAGAGFGDHLHFHIVPRWNADSNFMTTTADTRVIPEALPDTAQRVRAAVAALAESNNGGP